MNRHEFGETLRELRKSKSWTLADAAKNIGTSATYISSLESGGIRRPRYPVLRSIAIVYALSERSVLETYYPSEVETNERRENIS